jgi:hypothetical protein
MRFLVHSTIPHEPFNSYVRDGSVGAKIGKILEATKPEHIYFCDQHGGRGGTAVYHLNDNSDIPKIAEPWFLTFDAELDFKAAMAPEDLMKADLEGLGKTWG